MSQPAPKRSKRLNTSEYLEMAKKIKETPLNFRHVEEQAVNPPKRKIRQVDFFPIERLPYLARFHFIKCQVGRDLFAMSLINESLRADVIRTRRVIDHIHYEVVRNSVNINFGFDDNHEDVFIKIQLLDKKEYDLFNINKKTKTVNLLGKPTKMKTVCNDAYDRNETHFFCCNIAHLDELLLLFTRHLNRTFITKEYGIELQAPTFSNIQDLSLWKLPLPTAAGNSDFTMFDYIVITRDRFTPEFRLSKREMNFLLNRKTTHLEINVEAVEGFRYEKKFSQKQIKLHFSSWVAVDNILGMETKLMKLKNGSFSSRDARKIVRSFLNKETNVDFIGFSKNRNYFKQQEIVENLQRQEMRPMEIPEIYENVLVRFETHGAQVLSRGSSTCLVKCHRNKFKLGALEDERDENGEVVEVENDDEVQDESGSESEYEIEAPERDSSDDEY